MDTVSEFHTEAIASEGLAQGPYVVARAAFEPATLRTKGDGSSNEPPCPLHALFGITESKHSDVGTLTVSNLNLDYYHCNAEHSQL